MPQAETVAVPKRLPLVISPENRGSSVSYDSRLVNCFTEMEKDADGKTTQHWIYERPGMSEDSQPPGGAAAGYGVWNWLGNIYSIFDDTVYKDGVAVSGTVDTTNGTYDFSQSLGATPRLQLGNGVKAYNYDSSSGLVVISDADFPSAFVKGWAFLDGTTYVMVSTANIQGSDLNDTTSWDPLNTIIAQIEPDLGVATNKQLVYVIAFKQWSTEVFYDAGNATGSPLGTVQGAKISYGCASSDSVQDINGVLCWLSRNREAGMQVVAMEGLKMKVVSTPAIERLLSTLNTTTIFSWQFKIGGHRFYVLTSKVSNLTLAYDLLSDEWCQFADTNGNYLPIVGSTYTAAGKTLVQHESNGKLYLFDMSYATDDGDLIQVDIYTPNFDGGTRRRKTMKKLTVVGDQQVGSLLQVRVNDYDFDPTRWTNFRNFDMSKREPFITDCGTFTRRVHDFRHRQPVRMPRIAAMEMQVDLGTL